LLVFRGKFGLHIPIERADAFTAVAHQEVDVIAAFADIEVALEIGATLRPFLNSRNA